MYFLVAQSANLVTERQGLPGVLHDWPVSSFSLWNRSFSTAIDAVMGG